MGSRGTMIVEQEKEILLYKEIDRNTWKPGLGSPKTTTVTVENGKAGKPVVEASPSAAGPSAASSLGNLATADPSRGYREELEHFAYCIRHGNASNVHDVPDKDKPRCRGEVALADAVIALTSNLAMRQKRRIDFNPNWFDWQSPEVPENATSQVARKA